MAINTISAGSCAIPTAGGGEEWMLNYWPVVSIEEEGIRPSQPALLSNMVPWEGVASKTLAEMDHKSI